ncbi:MAG TPA: LLM class flavin-dependent oxidoreductase, partial [Streptosporangiaceae bacterium]|nr:LLM class flavin-dependent oxidoreductase [Streptosporangiaceae bacterium]
MAAFRRAIAVPNFRADPADLIGLGVAAEEAGFDGFFLWDHIVFSNSGDGPPVADPWLALAVVAARTSRIRLGTMITPVPRRRPWQLARQTATLDRLSGGRVILGVGIGSPAYGDFGIFHEPTGNRVRADMLDEGLAILAGLWSGERFSYEGRHFTVDPVRFTPAPVQRPRIPVWVGGVLPGARPIARAARWDGMVPIRYADRRLVRPSAEDIAGVR